MPPPTYPIHGHALRLDAPGRPLARTDMQWREPGPGEVLLRVHACGVCRSDLHVVDGELAQPKPHVVLGHEIVGRVLAVGAGVDALREGERVGVPWLAHTCGSCADCRRGDENLCANALFTGYTRDGGFATHALADARYCFALPGALDDLHAAPLLCAGLIAWRALRFAGDARRIGLYGFGAAAHLVAQVAIWQGREVHAFTRADDTAAQSLARELGCAGAWASDAPSPVALDAALLFAPVGALVPMALSAVRRGGQVICAGIHMSDIPAFPYALLWGERCVRSVANLTRADGDEFLRVAAQIPLRPNIEVFPLARAHAALAALREGRVRGAAVLDCMPGAPA